MGMMDWLTIFAFVLSIVAFVFSYKWSQDSDRNLQEIRRVAEEIKQGVEQRTKDIERSVEHRTEKIEQIVDSKTQNIERILEERLRDLIDRAAPKVEDKAMGDFMTQYGGQLFMEAIKNPELMRTIMAAGKNSGN